MFDLIVCLLLLVGISACVAEFYFVAAYVHSGFGKYPPFFPSFGKMKKVCLLEAEKYLRAAEGRLKIADLGCGSGSLLIPLAKKFPNHEFYGYDWDVVPFAIASFRARYLKNIRLFCKDFTKTDFVKADLILIFGGKKLFAEWGENFIASLRPGTQIISEVFPLPQLKPLAEIETPSYGMPLKVYIYQTTKKRLAK